MLNIIEFGLRHLALLSALIVVISTLVGLELYCRAFGSQALSPMQIVQLMNQETLFIADLRGATQFKQARIKGAKQLNYEACIQALKSIAPNTPLLIISSAQNSIPYKLSRYLRAQQFTRFYHIAGGLRAWQQAGLPLAQS